MATHAPNRDVLQCHAELELELEGKMGTLKPNMEKIRKKADTIQAQMLEAKKQMDTMFKN